MQLGRANPRHHPWLTNAHKGHPWFLALSSGRVIYSSVILIKKSVVDPLLFEC